MAIVWSTELDVDAYAAAGRGVSVPRATCPACRAPLRFWGWYERDVRVSEEVIHRLLVRRGRCSACLVTHALLPGFVTLGRLDPIEVIGPALRSMCGGEGMRTVAERVGLKHTTVRDWRRRFARRAGLLTLGFCRYVVAVGDLAPRLRGGAEADALGAIDAAWAAARRRFGARVAELWRFGNAVVGGHLLTTNIDPPWAAV